MQKASSVSLLLTVSVSRYCKIKINLTLWKLSHVHAWHAEYWFAGHCLFYAVAEWETVRQFLALVTNCVWQLSPAISVLLSWPSFRAVRSTYLHHAFASQLTVHVCT